MKWLLLIASSMVLVGCSKQAPEPEKPVEPLPAELQQFAWLQGADSERDAKAALANKDFRLFAISGRGLMIPGIAAEDRESAKQKCGVKYMDGMGDVLRDPEHRKWHKKGKDYAKAYNLIVSKQCLK